MALGNHGYGAAPMPAEPADTRALELSVVLPAHNEEGILATTVAELVDGLGTRHGPYEILILENGSSDATADLAAELAATLPQVRAFTDPVADYGQALRRGLLASAGVVVVNFDVDYYDLGFLDEAVKTIRSGTVGVVVGTKRGAGAQDDRAWHRRLVTRGFGLVLRVGFGLKASDTHGMKAMDRARLAPLAERCLLGTDLFDTELVLRAERSGIVVSEIPVHVTELRPARSPIARRVLRTVAGLGKLRVALRED